MRYALSPRSRRASTPTVSGLAPGSQTPVVDSTTRWRTPDPTGWPSTLTTSPLHWTVPPAGSRSTADSTTSTAVSGNGLKVCLRGVPKVWSVHSQR